MRTRVTASEEPGADARFCLVFPREALSVPVMRRVLGETLDQLGVTDGCVADLLLAVTEACTNVLRHSGPGLRYEVVARVGPDHCLLEVVDGGRGFDPAAMPGYRASWPRGARRPIARLRRRPVTELAESGRGLAIMRACVDDVTLRSRPGHGTVVSLAKRIELRSDAPLSRRSVSQRALSQTAGPPQLRDAG